MDKACIDSLLAEGPPPMPGRLEWEPDSTTLSARCPICGETCNIVYLDLKGLTLGCDRCVVVAYVHDFAVDKGAEE